MAEEEKKPSNPNPQGDPNNPFRKKKKRNLPQINFYWLYIILIAGFAVMYLFPKPSVESVTWYDIKNKMLKNHDIEKIEVVKTKDVAKIYIKAERLKESRYNDLKGKENNGGPQYYMDLINPEKFLTDLSKAQEEFAYQENEKIEPKRIDETDTPWLLYLIYGGLFFAAWMFIMRRVGGPGGGGGGQLFNIGKSKATLFDKDTKVNVTFADVAGLEEAKVEVMEIVDFLKNPTKYTKLGGKIPKGALLVGPPGTGKTLMAKAVAGEANVPFFSLSGSDFVEMFVGVGASRVRDLFRQAKEKAPCIIFIDEIDAIGRARGRSMVQGGNDERENTLNQLLTEMDGFGTDSGVIILAATNRPDILDSALMRPGRFDRQISIDGPDLNGREHIFKVHLKPLKLGDDIDPKRLSAQTPGFAGADIANVCNEAALIAARNNKECVEMQDFHDAIDRVIGGLEKKNKIISPEEKRIIAYHEAGHAISGWFLEHADPVVKVSIVPRGVAALGYAQYLPKEQYLYTTEQLTDTICMTLGGRVAEDIVFGRISTGASNDLERVTKTCYAMVTMYGMNNAVGNVNFYDPNNEYGFTKPYSEKTAEIIDEQVREMISAAYQRTKNLLNDKRDSLERVANELLKREVIFQYDLEEILGKRPFQQKTSYDEFVNGAIQPELEALPYTPKVEEGEEKKEDI